MKYSRNLGRFCGRLAACFSPVSRGALVFIVLGAAISYTYLFSALAEPVNYDERNWVDRSLKRLWHAPGVEHYPFEYYYATHHPSFARLVYRATLHAMGVYELDRPRYDYDHDFDWNLRRGAYPPLEIETPLRLVNVAFLSGMIALVYFALKGILANRALAAAGCLPLIFNHPIHSGAVPYIGTDSMLLFWLAAFLFAWLKAGSRPLAGPLVLGLVGGLMISTKYNGLFPLLGAAVFLGVEAKGWRRLLRPAVMVLLAGALFLALNPVYRTGGLERSRKAFKDAAELHMRLKEKSLGREWTDESKVELLRISFPYLFFYLPAAAMVRHCRRRRWLGVLLAWAGPTVLLNWLFIYVALPRYAAPITMCFLVLFAAAGLNFLRDTWRLETAAAARPGAWDPAASPPPGGNSLPPGPPRACPGAHGAREQGAAP